jgi:hypothetical protein
MCLARSGPTISIYTGPIGETTSCIPFGDRMHRWAERARKSIGLTMVMLCIARNWALPSDSIFCRYIPRIVSALFMRSAAEGIYSQRRGKRRPGLCIFPVGGVRREFFIPRRFSLLLGASCDGRSSGREGGITAIGPPPLVAHEWCCRTARGSPLVEVGEMGELRGTVNGSGLVQEERDDAAR